MKESQPRYILLAVLLLGVIMIELSFHKIALSVKIPGLPGCPEYICRKLQNYLQSQNTLQEISQDKKTAHLLALSLLTRPSLTFRF